MKNPGVWLAAVLGSAAMPAIAHADEPSPPATTTPAPPEQTVTTDPYLAMPLVRQEDKHYLRAGLEVGGIIAVGLVDYMLNTTARGGTVRAGDTRWSLRFDWPLFRDKLTGTGVNLDSNRFPTNYASHPFAGTMYFQAARSNHLSFAESFLFSILGSTTWEYFGEIRETTSINDLVVTPVSGTAIGETTMQLSAFFGRGRKSFGADALSFLFSPARAVNDSFDGSALVRSDDVDGLGFPRQIWHRFVLSAGAGVTVQESAGARSPRATYFDQRVGIDMSLANLPGYGGAAHEAHLYDDGNVSNFVIDATFSGGRAVDSLFMTRIVPIGYYVRDASSSGGSGGLLGMRMSFEYGMHEWDRDGTRPVDVTCFVSPVGVAAEYAYSSGDLRLRTGLDVYGAITGVTPYAFGDYKRLNNDVLRGLLTPLHDQGYYHSISVTAAPSVDLAWRSLRASARYRFDTFRPIRGYDENQPIVDDSIRMSDTRGVLEGTFAVEPRGTPLRLAVDGKRRTRTGELGAVRSSRSEESLMGSIGVVF